MPLSDRPYMRHDGGGGFRRGGGISIGLPRPTPAVKWLLIVNLGVFLIQIVWDLATRDSGTGPLSWYLGVTVRDFWQPWRYITFQFLHSTGWIWHIALNMLGVYMLGTPLETHWGSNRFLKFYLSCGVVAGIAYVIMAAAMRLDPNVPIIGASGGVYAIVLAAAVLFPHFRLLILFFPVPIRLAAVLIFGVMIMTVLGALSGGVTPDAFSQAAHLGGAAAAAMWIWVLPRLGEARADFRRQIQQGAWEKTVKQRQAEQAEIDRILDKIRNQGLTSLTDKERRTLQQATKKQRDEDNRIDHL